MSRELNPEVQKARDNAPFDGFTKSGVDYVEAVSHLMFLIQPDQGLGCGAERCRERALRFPLYAAGADRVSVLAARRGSD